MIEPEIIIVPIVFLTIGGTLSLISYFRHKEKMTTLGKPGSPELRAVESRMERLEQAIDSIAVEVERISEGQRFVTKVMAERDASRPLAPGEPPRIAPGSDINQ
ncbi:MAG TPA: hypothetical protein VN706_11420 [Gemmatimonadaceae bacterium]|nr:hypothetical protein [Gemmatimonadaceae bacterium]